MISLYNVYFNSFLEITQLNGLSEDQEQQQQQGDQEEEGSYVQVGCHVKYNYISCKI